MMTTDAQMETQEAEKRARAVLAELDEPSARPREDREADREVLLAIDVLDALEQRDALAAKLAEAHTLLARVEPELAPNHDLAKGVADKFGRSHPTLVEDIRAALAAQEGETDA